MAEMRVLVTGATGTLGHKLCQLWSERYECWGTVRRPIDEDLHEAIGAPRLIEGVDAFDTEEVRAAVERAEPDVVVNCIGAIKQVEDGRQPIPAIRINSLLPHELAAACAGIGARLIHISTDCVFSGARGGYTEDDVPDAADVYGRSKLLGEASGPGSLTLRTSLIGRELSGSSGLLEWLISNRGGEVKGFSRAVFSGLTTIGLAEEIGAIIDEQPSLDGLYHLAADPIDKLELLSMIDAALELGIEIVPDDSVVIDRSLDSSRLIDASGRRPRDWPELIRGLQRDPTPYGDLRNQIAER